MNQLPFDRLLNPPPQGGFNNPPCQINIAVPPQLSNILPHVIMGCANEAASKCMMHAGRIYTYNQLSLNNFNNSEFAMVVATAIDFLILGLAKGIYRAPEEGLRDAVEKALGAMTSLNIANNQQLQQVLQFDVTDSARNNINVFNQMQQEVQAIKSGQFQQPQGYGIQQPQQGYGYQQPQQQYVQQQYVQQQYVQQQQPQFQQPQMPQRQFAGQGGGTLFVANNGGAINQPVQNNASLRTFAKPQALVVEQPSTNFFKQPLQLTPVQPIVESAPVETSSTGWLPSENQLYPVTVSPKTQKHVVSDQQENGKVIKISRAIQLKDNEMDRSQHTLAHFGNKYTAILPMAYGTRAESINENVSGFTRINGTDLKTAKEMEETKESTQVVEDDVQKKVEEINCIVSPKWEIDSSLDVLVTHSKVKQLIAQGGDEPGSVFRSFGIHGLPIVLAADSKYSDVLEKLAGLTKHSEVIDVINELVNKLGKTTSDVYLAMRIDDYMTEVINRVIKNNLSIPLLSIDSYKEDILSLANYLKDTYSVVHMDAFVAMEAELLRLCFGGYHVTERDSLATAYVDLEELNKEVSIEFFISNYSFTQLSFHSSELNILPYSECASLVDSTTPILYKLCTTMIKQDKESNFNIYRRFIITEDNVMYEISEGWLTKNAITVALVK